MDARSFEDANAACSLLPGPSSTQLAIFCAYRVGGPAGAVIGGLGFVVPAVVLVLVLSLLFLSSSPPTWVRGAGAGAGAAVAAVAVRAGSELLGPSYRHAMEGHGHRIRWLAYLLAGAVAAILIGPYLVLVLIGCGLFEAARRAWFSGAATIEWTPSAVFAGAASAGGVGALAWTAFKVGALSFGGGFVIIPLMQEDAVEVYHWMSDAEFLNAVALGQVTPGPVVATIAAVGYAAHGVEGLCLRRRSRSFRRSRSSSSVAGGSSACARTTPHVDFSTAPGPRRSARSSARRSPLREGSTRHGRSAFWRPRRSRCFSSGEGSSRPWWPPVRLAPRWRLLEPLSHSARRYAGPMEEGTATTAAPGALGAAATTLLQRLIRIDTVNPPGNERALQEELAAMLTQAGFECELLAAEPERPNLVARLRGEREGPTLTLLGHVDTVRADPEEWSHDPWGGELIDGWIWGRGALDMKGQVAAELAACLELGRSGWRPVGELMLVVTADEEAGGAWAPAGSASGIPIESGPTSSSTRAAAR